MFLRPLLILKGQKEREKKEEKNDLSTQVKWEREDKYWKFHNIFR
jgi:hypothetical protein